MKQSFLLWAAVFFATAGAQAQPDMLARIHFLGGDKISADPNHFAFTNEFCSAPAKALESQTLDKLSRAPGVWFKSKIPVGAGDGAAQLRPLLDDLLKSEWVFEMRAATNGSPEYALAIRLAGARAQIWQNNLQGLLESWTKIPAQKNPAGWQLKKHEPPNLVQFSRSGDWVVVDCGQNELQLGDRIIRQELAKTAAETNWLSADLNWPRLAQIFPKLQLFDFPKIQMQAVGRGGDLQFNGAFTLAQALPPLQAWRVPTNLICQPFASFTAARSIGPWLARQSWMGRARFQPPPDQVFVWTVEGLPFQTFAAALVPDSRVALAQLNRNLSANTNWQNFFMGPPVTSMTNDEIFFGDVPFISPFVRAVHGPAGDFVFGGFFPNLPISSPLPPALQARLREPGLVYYHWETTAECYKALPQLTQLVLMLTQRQQLDGSSAAYQWLNHIGPALGSSVTVVTEIAPTELSFTRNAPGGLTALELLALASWLEATNFPGCDLRLPAVPQTHRPRRHPPGAPAPAPALPAPR